MKTDFFCAQCGTKVTSDSQFCPSCGRKLDFSKVAAQEGKKSYGTYALVIILGAFLICGWNLFSGVSETVRSAELNSQSANTEVALAERNTQKTFDDMERIATLSNNEDLLLEVKQMRLDWEMSKDDPAKLQQLQPHLDALMEKVKNAK